MFVFTKGKIKTVNRITTDTTVKQGGSRIKSNGEKKKEDRVSDNTKKSIRSNVWLYNVGNANKDDKTGHPAPFPEQLAYDHIISWSNVGDIVLDPFMGSGTTAKMAKISGRNFIGFELSEEYCNMANERLKNVVEANPMQLVEIKQMPTTKENLGVFCQ